MNRPATLAYREIIFHRHIDLSGRPCTPVPPTDHRLPMTCADNAPLTFRSQTKIRVSPRPMLLSSFILFVRSSSSSSSSSSPLLLARFYCRSRDTRDVYVCIFLTCWANVTRGRYRLSARLSFQREYRTMRYLREGRKDRSRATRRRKTEIRMNTRVCVYQCSTTTMGRNNETFEHRVN